MASLPRVSSFIFVAFLLANSLTKMQKTKKSTCPTTHCSATASRANFACVSADSVPRGPRWRMDTVGPGATRLGKRQASSPKGHFWLYCTCVCAPADFRTKTENRYCTYICTGVRRGIRPLLSLCPHAGWTRGWSILACFKIANRVPECT